MSTPSTASEPDPPQKLYIPQEIADLIYEALYDKQDALVLRLVCQTFANSLHHRIPEIYEELRRRIACAPYSFHERDFEFCIDDVGIGDIEVLTHPDFAKFVHNIVLIDRVPINHYLEHTTQSERDLWLRSRAARAQKHGSVQVSSTPDSLVYRTSPGVYEVPCDSILGRPQIVLREDDSDENEKSLYWKEHFSNLAFQKLPRANQQACSNDFTHDYTLRRQESWEVGTFDLRPSARTLFRLSKALSAFTNLKCVRTAPRYVIMIQPSKDNEIPARRMPHSCLLTGWTGSMVDDDVAWPAMHDFAAIMSQQISTTAPNLTGTLTTMDLTLYAKEHYPRHLSHTQNVSLLAKLISSCSSLHTLCLRDSDWLHGQSIRPGIRHILRCLAATSAKCCLERLQIDQAEPTSRDLLTILKRRQATLKTIRLQQSEDTNEYGDWIALFALTTDMPQLTDSDIDFTNCACCQDRALQFDGPGAKDLWDSGANLASTKSSLAILKDLRERERSNCNAPIYRPEDL